MKTTRRSLFTAATAVAGFLSAIGLKAHPQPHRGHMSDCSLHNEPAYPRAPCDCGLDNSKQMFVAARGFHDTWISGATIVFYVCVDGFYWYANFIPSPEWTPPRLSPGAILYLRSDPCALAVRDVESIPT